MMLVNAGCTGFRGMTTTQINPCHCARGWICEAHPDRPAHHDDCDAGGRPSDYPHCPYWQGADPLALDPSVQYDQTFIDRHAHRQASKGRKAS
jgi:hypothetical protein